MPPYLSLEPLGVRILPPWCWIDLDLIWWLNFYWLSFPFQPFPKLIFPHIGCL